MTAFKSCSFLKDSKIYKATKLTSLEIIVHNLDEEFLILNLNLKIVYRNDDFNSNLNKNFENVFLNYFEYNSAALILFKIKNSLREIQQSSYASKTAIIFYTNYEKAYKQILLIISVLIKDERILIKIKDISNKDKDRGNKLEFIGLTIAIPSRIPSSTSSQSL